MPRGFTIIVIILLLAFAIATALFVFLRSNNFQEPDYVLKLTEKQKDVQAEKLQMQLDRSGKEELLRSVIKLMKKKNKAALWYAISSDERQILLKKHGNDQEKIEKIFLELLLRSAGNNEQKFIYDMLRDRIPGIRMINIDEKWYIVPVELMAEKNIEF